MKAPSTLLDKPTPILRQRLYNGRKIQVWEGKIRISSISGWVDNPRIELEKQKYLSKVGQRELTQDEILELMMNDPEVRLKELRDDIIKNGLREPLTLSYAGTLLDGNRRFFAIKYALKNMPESDPNRQDLLSVEVHVLSEEATEEDEQNVLVEENFSASLKIEWPDYVKARKVVEAFDEGMKPEDLQLKFSWPKAKIKDTIKINDIITEFLAFATAEKNLEDDSGGGLGLTEQEAETIAAKNYQYFNEANKSFSDSLKTDINFKIQFFKWIYESKFRSFPEVRIAYSAWQNEEALAALMQPEPTAAKAAKAIIDYNSRVIKSAAEAVGRIDTFSKFLRDLTAADIKSLPENSRKNLEEALELVIKLTKAARE